MRPLFVELLITHLTLLIHISPSGFQWRRIKIIPTFHQNDNLSSSAPRFREAILYGWKWQGARFKFSTERAVAYEFLIRKQKCEQVYCLIKYEKIFFYVCFIPRWSLNPFSLFVLIRDKNEILSVDILGIQLCVWRDGVL